MEEAWEILLSQEPLEANEMDRYASRRGGGLFRFSARLLGGEAAVEEGGESWALVDLARHSANEADAANALSAARRRTPISHWPSRLRPLGMLAALAARDADPARAQWEPQGSPGRMLRMLRHRLTGR